MLTEAGEQCTVGTVGTVGRAFVTFSLLPDLAREGEGELAMARSRSEAKEAALRCGLLAKSRSDQLLPSSLTMCALAESVQVSV